MGTARLGWQHVERKSSDDEMSLVDSLADSRHRRFRYAHAIGDELLSEMEQYIDKNEEYDLDGELAILRHWVANDCKFLQAVLRMPIGTAEEKLKRADAMDLARAKMYDSIARVKDMVQAMARVKQATSGKVDLVMLNSLVTAVTQSVDSGLQHFSQPMLNGHVLNPQEIADHIASLVQGAIQEVAPGEALDQQNQLARKTSITTDALVNEMDGYHLEGTEAAAFAGLSRADTPVAERLAL